MKNNTYFKTFSNCLITNGYERSLILDIQRELFISVPNSLVDVIQVFNKKIEFEEVVDFFGESNREIIIEYLDFLVKNDFGFFTDFNEFDLFIDLNIEFIDASYITNCIIEISKTNLEQIHKILISLEKLFCKNVQFVSYDNLTSGNLEYILNQTKDIDFRSIELILKYSEDLLEFMPHIDILNEKVVGILFHSSKHKSLTKDDFSFEIKYLESKISNFNNCGVVDFIFFDLNKDKVFESLNHNSCLHKKISIDKDGNIKNCPSMPQSFGNIKDTTLEEALNHLDFKKYWNVNKDMIQVCKDCEFRHICTDCRAYTERSHFEGEIDLSKPLKCGYNPYTNEWAEWSTNPLKQKAIEFYGMQDLVKKDA